MAGNSQRRGAKRTIGTKKGAVVGSGGQRRRALEGKGPTPRAQDRPAHKAYRSGQSDGESAGSGTGAGRASGASGTGRTSGTVRTSGTGRPGRTSGAGGAGRTSGASGASGASGRGRPGRASGTGRPGSGRAAPRARPGTDGPEWVTGRNSVVEALRAQIPAKALYVAERLDSDDRVRESLKLVTRRGVPLLEVPRPELDRMTGGAVHQGLALQVPPYAYAHPADLLERARDASATPLIVALDGVTDTRNLGAVVRSAAAFGAHGVVVPERRAAGMTSGAWKTAAGAAARLPVARATNLARALRAYQEAGCFVVGLDAGGTQALGDVDTLNEPLVLVVGAEGKGLSRLVAQTCDVLARIPIASDVESLNAGVAAGIALYEASRARGARGAHG